MNKIVADPVIVKDLLGRGIGAGGLTPEQLAKLVSDERQMWQKVIAEAGIQAN